MSERSGIWQPIERRLLDSGMPEKPDHLNIPQYLALVFANEVGCTVHVHTSACAYTEVMRQVRALGERCAGVAVLAELLPRLSGDEVRRRGP